MKNTDPHMWALSKQEKDAIAALESRGFDVVIKKRSITNDKIAVSRGGFTWNTDLPVGGRYTYGKYAEIVDRTFEMVKRCM